MTTTITLHEGDNRDHLRRLIDQGVRVHSVTTDPPYGLTSITKRFGGKNPAPAKFGTDGAFQRQSRGFMSSAWDGTGIERDPEFWRLIWEILLPGGYVLAFSAARTGHWQACSMEMAGFVMHPFLGWVYGSGFPKAHNAGRAIEGQLKGRGSRYSAKDPGLQVGGSLSTPGQQLQDMSSLTMADQQQAWSGQQVELTTPEAQQWDGWAYGGQSLKPALEPIYVGQKPFSEKNGALNLLKHGVGAVNIDGCRVAATGEGRQRDGEASQDRRYTDAGSTNFAATPGPRGGSPDGRHPANLLHDGSAEVVALFPQTPGQLARSSSSAEKRESQNCYGEMTNGSPGKEMESRNDAGSAARFFNSFPPDADPIRYQSKATKADRAGSKHPTVKPVALMQWLVRLVTPPGGTVLDPFGGSGTTAEAARREGFDCILMEADATFAADIRRRFALPAPLDPFADLLGETPNFDDLLGEAA